MYRITAKAVKKKINKYYSQLQILLPAKKEHSGLLIGTRKVQQKIGPDRKS